METECFEDPIEQGLDKDRRLQAQYKQAKSNNESTKNVT
jgi:hypothetical protein